MSERFAGWKRWFVILFFFASAITFASTARAQDVGLISDAAEAYDTAVALHRAKEYARAALFFARADELAQNDTALSEAIRAAILANHAPLAIGLSDRASERTPNADLTAAVREARQRFAQRTGRIVVRCPAGQTCALTVDGIVQPAVWRGYVIVGSHRAVLQYGGESEERVLSIGPDTVVEFAPTTHGPKPVVTAPLPAPPPVPSKPIRTEWVVPSPSPAVQPRAGVAPVWFWISLGATSLLTGGAIASGVDVSAKHDAFSQNRTDEAADDGRAAELRTNVLIGVAAGAAVGTGVLGLFAVNWKSQGGAAHTRSAHSLSMTVEPVGTPPSALPSHVPGRVQSNWGVRLRGEF